MYRYKLYIIFIVLVSSLIIIGTVRFYNQEKDIEETYKKDSDAENIDFKYLKTRSLRAEEVPPQEVIFSTEESWMQFWNTYGEGEVPQIDFSQYVLVGIFLGARPNSGYGVEITNIERVNDQILIRFVEYLDRRKSTLTVIVYPYNLIRIPKISRNIIFHGSKEVRE